MPFLWALAGLAFLVGAYEIVVYLRMRSTPATSLASLTPGQHPKVQLCVEVAAQHPVASPFTGVQHNFGFAEVRARAPGSRRGLQLTRVIEIGGPLRVRDATGEASMTLTSYWLFESVQRTQWAYPDAPPLVRDALSARSLESHPELRIIELTQSAGAEEIQLEERTAPAGTKFTFVGEVLVEPEAPVGAASYRTAAPSLHVRARSGRVTPGDATGAAGSTLLVAGACFAIGFAFIGASVVWALLR